ncbi:MAG: hypothetical protein ACQETD_03275 [Pseudomonadota bacterium]
MAALLLPLLMLSGCSDSEPGTTLLGEASGCDAATGSCRVSGDEVAVIATLEAGLQPLKPFSVQVDIQGLEVDSGSVIADFQMKGMDMGVNRYRLKPGQEGLWQGTATLPVCTASRMDWYMDLSFSAEGSSYRARFPFETVSN